MEVGLLTQRSREMMIAAKLGVLKAGAAILPRGSAPLPVGVRSVVRDLEVVPVAGHHLDLFSAPSVEPLCAELAKRLGDGGEEMREPDDAPRRAVAGV